MVFLSVGGDYGIARSCIAVHFILADHGGGGILGNHEAGVQTGVGYEKMCIRDRSCAGKNSVPMPFAHSKLTTKKAIHPTITIGR